MGLIFSSSETYTITDFCRKPAEHIKRIQESKCCEPLTFNGKAAVVVQDAESYEKMAELADYADSILQLDGQ